ncbi:MAG: aspartate 1-decarboxylase [candidate division Zixibacteria bacterium]|nr:aspartate 1-decarboxylase [candidate division Zixibacteria bacterium]
MLTTVCKSKIHRATITDANVNYEGSITIDVDLMKAADIVPFEKVQIANVTNGERLETYVIEGEAGSGSICLNGAAALKGKVGDIIIIIAYGLVEHDKAQFYTPKFVKVDKNNRII